MPNPTFGRVQQSDFALCGQMFACVCGLRYQKQVTGFLNLATSELAWDYSRLGPQTAGSPLGAIVS